LARIDRKRKKKGSNDDWTHPQDPDAKITKMKMLMSTRQVQMGSGRSCRAKYKDASTAATAAGQHFGRCPLRHTQSESSIFIQWEGWLAQQKPDRARLRARMQVPSFLR
jgi:hypothetical protein